MGWGVLTGVGRGVLTEVGWGGVCVLRIPNTSSLLFVRSYTSACPPIGARCNCDSQRHVVRFDTVFICIA